MNIAIIGDMLEDSLDMCNMSINGEHHIWQSKIFHALKDTNFTYNTNNIAYDGLSYICYTIHIHVSNSLCGCIM